MRRRSLGIFGLGALAAIGCVTAVASKLPVDGFVLPTLTGEVPWTGAAPLRDESDFDFVVVTDRTGEHRDGVFEEQDCSMLSGITSILALLLENSLLYEKVCRDSARSRACSRWRTR